jgi:hypothetical protein
MTLGDCRFCVYNFISVTNFEFSVPNANCRDLQKQVACISYGAIQFNWKMK